MKPGKYHSPKGSKVVVYGGRLGSEAIQFDWLEEGGCTECTPWVEEVDGAAYLMWNCDNCSGNVRLIADEP